MQEVGSSDPPVSVLGFPIASLTMDECVRLLAGWLAGPGSDMPRVVFTANPEMLTGARRDPDLRAALDQASLLVADGVGVVWASSLLGGRVPGRLTGIDLLDRLLALSPKLAVRPFFLGGSEDMLHDLRQALSRRYPGIEPAGFHHGFFDLDDHSVVDNILKDVRQCGAHFLVVGMGVPRDQLFIQRFRDDLGGVRLAMGVGGSLDVLSGRVKRAPAWVRGMGLEWLYRLVSSPRRLGRQASLPRFALCVVGQAVRERRDRRTGE